MDDLTESGAELGRQLGLLVNVIQEEESEYAQLEQEFNDVAERQIQALTRDLAPR
jgi:hypothetical protein